MTVLIAGAGPVGMTLALELARHGVASRMFERAFTTTRHPKMDITNGRSMELFRRLGLADKLRAAGVPDTHPLDVAWVTSMAGHELHRFKYAPPAALRAHYQAINDGAQPLEPAMRVSQIVVEPILQAAVLAEPLIDARWGMAVEGAGQSKADVWIDVRDRETNQVQRVKGAYLAGCDGGNSTVRNAMDIGLEGDAGVANRYMIHFKSDDRAMLQRFGVAWHYQSPAGTLIAQNDVDTWTLHARFPDAVDPDSVDPMDTLRAFLGADINAEILVANPWEPHLLLADAYQNGRVFLAGDAAHQYIPTGGYGMNTGIGDAVALGWMLAATVNGWGGPGLLAAYEAERRPIGGINRGWSGKHTGVRIAIMEAYQAYPNAATDAGERASLAAAIAALGNLENEAWGVEFAYRYDASPLIAPILAVDPGLAPSDDPATVPASAWPGMRAPSFILPDGQALFDLFDPSGFTLLCFNSALDTAVMEQTGTPVTRIDLAFDAARDAYGADLALIRPDGHLAWRGDTASAWAVKVAAGAAAESSSPDA
jgi:2-polyprenyl-6-methoxyphenol hydroxylase-like FAD-dependent oxidoreductase